MKEEDKIIQRHVTNMLNYLDSGNNKSVFNEFEKLDKKLTSGKYNSSTLASHIVIKAIALARTGKLDEANANIANLINKKLDKLQPDQKHQHVPEVYTDSDAISVLGYYYSNEAYDFENLEKHWEAASKFHPKNDDYKRQYFMSLVKNIKPEKMKLVAMSLYKTSEKNKEIYLNWAAMSMLAEQAINDANINNEEKFSEIAKIPPPAENKLLSNLAMKTIEKNFKLLRNIFEKAWQGKKGVDGCKPRTKVSKGGKNWESDLWLL